MTNKERQDLEQEYNRLKTKTDNARFVDPADMLRREEILSMLMQGGLNAFTIQQLKHDARCNRLLK